jgi:hypothetical protein
MVAVNEISWEEASASDFGQAHRQAFRAAVAQIAAKATATLPESTGRIENNEPVKG